MFFFPTFYPGRLVAVHRTPEYCIRPYAEQNPTFVLGSAVHEPHHTLETLVILQMVFYDVGFPVVFAPAIGRRRQQHSQQHRQRHRQRDRRPAMSAVTRRYGRHLRGCGPVRSCGTRAERDRPFRRVRSDRSSGCVAVVTRPPTTPAREANREFSFPPPPDARRAASSKMDIQYACNRRKFISQLAHKISLRNITTSQIVRTLGFFFLLSFIFRNKTHSIFSPVCARSTLTDISNDPFFKPENRKNVQLQFLDTGYY